MNLVVVSIPSGVGGDPPHDPSAAAVWRAAGLVQRLALHVDQAVWVSLPPAAHPAGRYEKLASTARQLASTIQTVCSAGAMPLVVGGDRLITALGIVAGLQASGSNTGIAWFDAYDPLADGETAGRAPLSLITGARIHPLAERVGVGRRLAHSDVLLAGLRSLRADDDSGLAAWSAADLLLTDADPLGRSTTDWRSAYLHLDLSVLDPVLMPAVEEPAPEGIDVETLVAAVEAITAYTPVVVLGVSNFVPSRDKDGRGLATSMQALESIVGILAL